MEFPDEFPQLRPEITFMSKVYHPLIAMETGELDMKVTFFILNFILYLKRHCSQNGITEKLSFLRF